MAGYSESFLKACAKGDERSQYNLYRKLYPSLMAICLRYANDQNGALEFLNEGFYKILKNLKKYRSHVPFEAWAKRVQINVVIDAYRKEQSRPKEILHDFEGRERQDISAETLNEVEERISQEYLMNLIQQLPNTSKTVFCLHAVDGLSYDEIAEALSMRKGTIKWHVHNARTLLQASLQQIVKKNKAVVNSA